MKDFGVIHKNIDRIDVYRLHDWFYYLGFFILGDLIRNNNMQSIRWSPLLICSLALSFIYALNDYTDREKKHPFFIYPLLLMVLCRKLITLKQWIPLGIFLALQIVYSVKPLRFKKIPVVGTLCCMLGFPQIFLMGCLDGGSLDIRIFLIFLLLVLLSGVIQLIHEIDDVEEDALMGIRTSAVFYGKKIINYACIILLIFSIVVSFDIYILRIINMATFLSLSIFQLYILGEIFFKGITHKTRFRFRFLGLLTGGIWIISIVL